MSSLLFSAQTQSPDLTNAMETLMFRSLLLQILSSDLASVLSWLLWKDRELNGSFLKPVAFNFEVLEVA